MDDFKWAEVQLKSHTYIWPLIYVYMWPLNLIQKGLFQHHHHIQLQFSWKLITADEVKENERSTMFAICIPLQKNINNTINRHIVTHKQVHNARSCLIIIACSTSLCVVNIFFSCAISFCWLFVNGTPVAARHQQKAVTTQLFMNSSLWFIII